MSANSLRVSTNPPILFKESTQLLNDPCPGKTILSQDLISNLITIIKYKPEFYN